MSVAWSHQEKLGEGPEDRRKWVENRLEELADIFSIAVGGFSVMDHPSGGRRSSNPMLGDSYHRSMPSDRDKRQKTLAHPTWEFALVASGVLG